jgi:hypothetical protein
VRLRGAAAAIAALLLLALLCAAAGAAVDSGLRVRGSSLIDGPGRGHVVRLLGVNRSGLEYACIQGWGFFQSPDPDRIDSAAMIAAMKSWDIDAVRVPLNEDCWLGLKAPPGRGGVPYRRIVARYVRALNRAGLYVILDLHWAGAGPGAKAVGQTPMATPRTRRPSGALSPRPSSTITSLCSTCSTSRTGSPGGAGCTAVSCRPAAICPPIARPGCSSWSTRFARPVRRSR